MKSPLALAGAIIALTICVANPAFAHADLVKSNPAPGATVSPPKAVVLIFSEEVSPAFSGFDLGMSDGMKVPLSTAFSSNGKIVTCTLQGRLMRGAYKLSWHVAAADDGHRTDGTFSFKVK